MYSVIFMDKNHKEDSTYYYNTYDEALEHFNMFIDDDSNLYSNISIMNENSRVIELIMLFDDTGKMYSKIANGDIVKFRPEWCKPAELNDRYRVKNIHEEQETCLIIAINSKIIFGSSEQVGLETIEVVKDIGEIDG